MPLLFTFGGQVIYEVSFRYSGVSDLWWTQSAKVHHEIHEKE